MQIYWSEFAFDSLIEIIAWYKIEAGDEVAKAVKKTNK
jgi:plasmid stabilization system protein ParE